MKLQLATAVLVLLATAGLVAAADHRAEPLAELAPADGYSPEILAELEQAGLKVIRGKSRTLSDIWLCKSWAAAADFAPSSTVIYPFEPGQLIGVVRYKTKGGDFRGQQIPPGLYVLRYSQQPVDGNHVGTSDTRDFLILTPANVDKAVVPIEQKALFKLSAKVAGTTHPVMLSLKRTAIEPAEAGSLRHDKEADLWILQAAGKTAAEETPGELRLDIVVAGEAVH